VKTCIALWLLLSCLIGTLRAQEWSPLTENYTDTGTLAFYTQLANQDNPDGTIRHMWRVQWNPLLKGMAFIHDVQCNDSPLSYLRIGRGYNHVWTLYWDDVNTKGKWSWRYEVFLDRKRVRR
jgi:hypothetical protein